MPSPPDFPRLAVPRPHDALADARAILIHGTRQCGKTTLARTVCDPLGHGCLTFDDDTVRAAAADPAGFLTDPPGWLVLSGSTSILLIPSLSNSASFPTIRDYVALLARVFLLEELPPWHRNRLNRLNRLVKTPKLHIGDTGLAAALLGVDAADLWEDRTLLEQLLETFVLQELRRLAVAQDAPTTFHHFRDKDGVEVDLVVERGPRAIAGVEVKAGATVTDADYCGLRKVQQEAPEIGSSVQISRIGVHLPSTTAVPPTSRPTHPMNLSRTTRRHAFAFAALSLIAASACSPDSSADDAAALADSAADSAGSMAADSASQPPASPRDSLAVNIAGADITVNYGRPSKRGRTLFNGMGDMKWGMVWRTGANEATAFTTSKPLAFGNATVPAGNYTLFTHLVENGQWELVINKQTGQWGTAYDATQDLVRVPMTVTSDNPVTEMLTITVTPAGQGGELAVAWDNYKAVAPFTVK